MYYNITIQNVIVFAKAFISMHEIILAWAVVCIYCIPWFIKVNYKQTKTHTAYFNMFATSVQYI